MPTIDLQKMVILEKKIIFSDEVNFDLGGYVKQAKLSHLGHRKPARIHWKANAPKTSYCLVWIWSKGIIELVFLENEQGEVVTVNGDRYRLMLHEFLFTKIEEKDIGNIWFQQHGATWRTDEATLDVLGLVFEDRIISRRADIVWPPRSCDLTPLNYYLWDAVKDKCYADKPETINALKDNIRETIGEIQLHTIDNVLKNCIDRVGYFMASRDKHVNEIIFQ